jgi:hypothetical protein
MTSGIARRVLDELRTTARHKAPADRSAPGLHILLGPVVERPEGHDHDQPFYFVTMGGTERTHSTICIGGPERSLPEEFRTALAADLVNQRPIVIHDFDDELEMAKWGAAIWPCKKTQRVLDAIRQERAAHPEMAG